VTRSLHRPKVHLVWLALVLFGAAACEIDPDNPYDQEAPAGLKPRGSIAGEVLLSDAADRSGVAVRVLENGRNAVTGADGTYRIADLESSSYTVQLSKAGYRTETRFAIVRLGADVVLDEVTLKDLMPPAPPRIIEPSCIIDIPTECDADAVRRGTCTAETAVTVEGGPFPYAGACDAADPSTTFTADADGAFAFEVRGGTDYSEWTRVCYGDEGLLFHVAENAESRLRVRKVDPEGNASSDDFILITEDSEPPAAPVIVDVIEGRDRARVFWEPSPSIDTAAYRVYYGAADKSLIGTFAREGDSPIDVGPATEFTLSGLNPGTMVFIAVSAVDGVGIEGPTSETTIALPNPVTPEPAGLLDLSGGAPGEVLDLAVSGDLALVARGPQGIDVVDLSDRGAPERIGRLAEASPATGVALTPGLAAVTAGAQGLMLVDLTDPTTPAIIGRLGATDMGLTDVDLVDVSLSGRYAALANAAGDDGAAGLLLADLSDPGRPVLAGQADLTGTPHSVALSGRLAFASTPSDGSPSIEILDIDDPAVPLYLAGVPTADLGRPRELIVSGERLYAANRGDGLEVLTLNRAALLDPAHDCDTEGDCVVAVGTFDTPDSVYGAVVAGGLVGIADAEHGLVTIGTANPGNPDQLGRIGTDGKAVAVALRGSHAAVALADERLQLIELAAPRAPTPTASVVTRDTALDVAVIGHCALVADGQAGVTAVDLNDPAGLRLAGTVESIGTVSELLVDGDLAIARSPGSSLALLDVSDPCRPALLGTWQPQGPRIGGLVLLPGRLLLVALEEREVSGTRFAGRLTLIDIADPTAPAVLASAWATDLGFPAERALHFGELAVAGERAFVVERLGSAADTETGLGLFDLSALLADPGTCRSAPDACLPDSISWVALPELQRAAALRVIDRNFIVLLDALDSTEANGRLLVLPADLEPASPTVVSTLELDSIVGGLRADGSYLYIGAGDQGLVVVDRSALLSDPEACAAGGCTLSVTARLALEDEAHGLDVAGPWVLVADGLAGLRVVELE